MIHFFTEEIDFDREDSNYLKKWLLDIVVRYNYSTKYINYIFCNDEYLLEINERFLKHDYYTDIITFQYSEKKEISADIYISIDRVQQNSIDLNCDFEIEFLRILVHGILHIVGFEDKTEEEVKEMRKEEDKLIELYRKNYV